MSKVLNTPLPLLSGQVDVTLSACFSLFKLPTDTQDSLVLEPSGLKTQAPASPPGRSFGREASVAAGWASGSGKIVDLIL